MTDPVTPAGDGVLRPAHYTRHPSGIECIDVAEHVSFNVGNAIKYLWRHGQKPMASADEDLRKAIWYIERERKRLAKLKGPGHAP